MSNGLDHSSVGPDLAPNCLQDLSADEKNFRLTFFNFGSKADLPDITQAFVILRFHIQVFACWVILHIVFTLFLQIFLKQTFSKSFRNTIKQFGSRPGFLFGSKLFAKAISRQKN